MNKNSKLCLLSFKSFYRLHRKFLSFNDCGKRNVYQRGYTGLRGTRTMASSGLGETVGVSLIHSFIHYPIAGIANN